MTENMFETIIDNKRYLHNNMIAFDEDYNGVSKEKKKEIKECLKEYVKEVKSRYDYEVKLGNYGLEVWMDNTKGSDLAYLGYDESVNSRIRLNYTSSAFLGVHLIKSMKSFKELGEELESSQELEQEGIKPERKKEQNVEWLGESFEEFKDYSDQKVEQLLKRMVDAGMIDEKEAKRLEKELGELYKKDSSEWLKESNLEKGTWHYNKVLKTLKAVSKRIPKTKVVEEDSGIKMEDDEGKGILDVCVYVEDRQAFSGEVVSFSKDLVFYTGYKKLINILASNIGYKKLMKQIGEDGVKVKSNKEEKTNEPEVEDKEEKLTVIDIKSSNDYYDFYIKVAGNWAGEGKVFIKEQIESIVEKHEEITGASLLVKDGGNMYIDWTVNNETVTMAITTNPREIYILDEKFDISVAYDPKYEEIVESLMESELEIKGYL